MSNTELAQLALAVLQGVNVVALFILITLTLLAIAVHHADVRNKAIQTSKETAATEGLWIYDAATGRTTTNSRTPANSGDWDDYAIRGTDHEDNCVVFPVPTKLNLTKDEFASLIAEDAEAEYDYDNRMQNQIFNLLPYLDVRYVTVPKVNVKLMKVEDVIHL